MIAGKFQSKLLFFMLGTITAATEAHCLFETDLRKDVIGESWETLKKIHAKAKKHNKMSLCLFCPNAVDKELSL